MRQFRYFILTIPSRVFEKPTCCPEGVQFFAGQEEIGEGGFRHWQCIAYFKRKISLMGAKEMFPRETHIEPSRSIAVENYVFKDETKVAGTEFEFGVKPFNRNKQVDWMSVRRNAEAGTFHLIPDDIFVRYISSISRIFVMYSRPVVRGPQEVVVIWGPTGTGKSRMAFEMAGEDYYLKAPLTKWFDGYSGQEVVILDEFRGVVDISHLLKWFDRYPCSVEVKGSQVFLNTKKWIITSNLPPQQWYPGLDVETLLALRRRFSRVIHKINGLEEIQNQ